MGKHRIHRRSRSDSESSEDSCNEDYLKKMYLALKTKLVQDKSLQVAGSDAYGSFYSLEGQQINSCEAVRFTYSQVNRNIELGDVGQTIYVRRDGLFNIVVHLTPDGASQWTLFVNNIPQYDFIFGTYNSSGQVTLTYLIALRKDDVITLRNYQSASSVIAIPQIVGGTDYGANAEIVFEKIAPYPEKYVCNDRCKCKDKEDDRLCEKEELKLSKEFLKFKKWLKYDATLMVKSCDAYGSFYSTTQQTVNVNSPVLFNKNQNVFNMTHTLGNGEIKILKDGIYLFTFIVECSQACQFTVFINGIPDQTSTGGINKGANVLQLRQEIPLKAGDVVSMNNHVSAVGSVVVSQNAGGNLIGVNAELILCRIAPLPVLCDVIEQVSPCLLEKDRLYRMFKKYLLEDDRLSIQGCSTYFYISSSVSQTLNLEDHVIFNLSGASKNTLFKTGTDNITVLRDGVYKLSFDLQAKQPSQFTIFVNDEAIESTIAGTDSGSGQVSIRQLVSLNAGDIITVKNHSSFLNPVITTMNPGGILSGLNVVFCGKRIAQLYKKKSLMPPQKP